MGIKLVRNNLIFTLLLVLTACGYHLRGAIDIPEQLKNVYIQSASGSLHNEIKLSLKSSGGQLVSSPDQAGMVIKVIKEDMRRRVLSLSSTGKSNEFELNYRLIYMLVDAQGKVLMNQQEVEIDRDYFNDQEDILAKNNEEIVIRQEMYRQAVRTIFAHSRAVLKNKL